MSTFGGLGRCVAGLACLVLSAQLAHAQEVPPEEIDDRGVLVDLMEAGTHGFNRLEVLAARQAQYTYNYLSNLGCTDSQVTATEQCSGDLFRTFGNVRELVHTANELLAREAPTQFSLGLAEDGLGFALRWVAAEELLAPGFVGSQFTQGQMASLLSRMTALRFGAGGFTVMGMPLAGQGGLLAAARGGALGGGAGDSGGISRLGGFLNGSFNWGDRAPSDLEDAFDFDGTDVSAGIDYRFRPTLVLGAMGSYYKQRIDFDSTQSVVDGGIRSDGWGLALYGMQEWNGPYVGASVGYQNLTHDITRDINYPSFNPDVDPVYATATGSTTSKTLSATLDLGWNVSRRALGFEPYLRAEYGRQDIDAFAEDSVSNAGPNAGEPAGFDFAVGDQRRTTFKGTAGVRLQYAFTPSFGVIVPYLRAEYHREFETDESSVSTLFNAIEDAPIAIPLPGDERDSAYLSFSAGTSVVLRGGWQLFGQAQYVSGLRFVKSYALTGGIRAEF